MCTAQSSTWDNNILVYGGMDKERRETNSLWKWDLTSEIGFQPVAFPCVSWTDNEQFCGFAYKAVSEVNIQFTMERCDLCTKNVFVTLRTWQVLTRLAALQTQNVPAQLCASGCMFPQTTAGCLVACYQIGMGAAAL